jgi:hypothetical protein
MAKYAQRDLHVDQLLTNLSIKYQNPAYIADQIFPIVPVMKQSDKYVVYDQSHWFRNEARIRAPGTKSERGGWSYSEDTFFCDRFSYGVEIFDEERDNSDVQFDLDRDATEFATDKILMQREVAFASGFFTTGVWGTNRTGVASAPSASQFVQWNDYANSDPLGDLSAWMDLIEASIGREPNRLVMGKQVWTKIKWHPDLIDTIKYTQRAQMTMDLAEALFEIERILIGRAIYTTSPEGTAEASVSYSRIWGKHLLATFVPASASLRTPAAGYTFTWNRVPNSMMYIKRMRDEEREADIIEANGYYDHKLTGAKAGLFADQVVA